MWVGLLYVRRHRRMSVVYSHRTGKFIDTDEREVVSLLDGDCIEWDNDDALLEAFDDGLLSEEEMLGLGFDMDQLYE
jgi:hypothetical protein